MPPCPFLPWLKSIACAALLLAGGSLPAAEKSPAPFNVLFIAVDDLNDWVGAFGGAPQKKSATPHLDRFAKSGSVVFQQANCAGPVCGPSRSALLSGFMPHRSGVYGNSQNMRGSALVQTHLTLPEFFSKHGYHTLSNGKIFTSIRATRAIGPSINGRIPRAEPVPGRTPRASPRAARTF